MTEKELIRFLRTGNRKPSEEMVERCINSLPEITNQNHLIPLIRLQAGSLPLTVYLLSVCVIVVPGLFVVMLPPIEALKLTGILSAASLMNIRTYFILTFRWQKIRLLLLLKKMI